MRFVFFILISLVFLTNCGKKSEPKYQESNISNTKTILSI